MLPGRIFNILGIESQVSIDTGSVMLPGVLALPKDAAGIVLFQHRSSGDRLNPQAQFVAETLQSRGIGTLLFDHLLREEELAEQVTGSLAFRVRLLADRLTGATRWIMRRPDLKELKIGYLGANAGAAAALIAARNLPGRIAAVVSHGGNLDLARQALRWVTSPTLLIVGGNDEPVMASNRDAIGNLRYCKKKLVIVPGATHLFEEPGALEAAGFAADWFMQNFNARHPARAAEKNNHSWSGAA